MIKKSIITFLLMTAIAPLLMAEKSPDWISGSSEKYPASTYLIGVGIAGNLDGARSAARAEIAKVFKSRISQSSEDMQQERSNTDGSASKTSSSSSSEIRTRVSTDEVMEGVIISETWKDQKRNISYALAVLDKPKMRSALAQQILDQEEIIKSRSALADKATSPIDTVRALTGVLKAMGRRDELLTRKRVIDPVSVPEFAMGATKTDVERKIEEAADKIVFIINTAGEKGLQDIVSSRISKLGFKTVLAAADTPADGLAILVTCKTATEPIERNNPQWKFYNWRSTVELSDGKTTDGKTIASATKEGQVSQLSDDAAKSKAFMAALDASVSAAEELVRKNILGE